MRHSPPRQPSNKNASKQKQSTTRSTASYFLFVCKVCALIYAVHLSLLVWLGRWQYYPVTPNLRSAEEGADPHNDWNFPADRSSGRLDLPSDAETCSCGNWGRWNSRNASAPRCCIRQTADATLSVIDMLEMGEISYTLSGGTLLGAIRCGSMMAWDYDADFSIHASMEKMRPLFHEWQVNQSRPGGILSRMRVTVGGLEWIGGGWGSFNRKTKKGDVHLDFGFAEVEGATRPCQFHGRLVKCRRDASAYLAREYGADWMVPRRWCNWDKAKLCDWVDEAEAKLCLEARREMRQTWCKDHPDLAVGAGGCNGDD